MIADMIELNRVCWLKVVDRYFGGGVSIYHFCALAIEEENIACRQWFSPDEIMMHPMEGPEKWHRCYGEGRCVRGKEGSKKKRNRLSWFRRDHKTTRWLWKI